VHPISEIESTAILQEIRSFMAESDKAQFSLAASCRVHLFKVFAHIVDGSKLPLEDLTEVSEKYLVAKLENLLEAQGQTDLTDSMVSML
jgi:hypothetical protein